MSGFKLFLILVIHFLACTHAENVCELSTFCGNAASLRSQMIAVRVEQERHGELFDNLTQKLDTCLSKTGVENKLLDDLTQKLDTFLSKAVVEKRLLDDVSLKLESCQSKTVVEKKLLDDVSLKLKSCLSKTVMENKVLNNVETKPYGKSCTEPSVLTQHSEINVILVPEYSKDPFLVACDQLSHGGGWTLFLRRTDGSEDFFRDWNDYKNGFGKLENEFFLGLDKLHAITTAEPQELLVLLEDNEGNRAHQMYDNFRIGSEENGFALESLGNSSRVTGDAGDAFEYHLGQKFTTKDRDNDKCKTCNCADKFSGAWWYKDCHLSNLAGKYGDDTNGKGINWTKWKGAYHSLKRAQMMIRRKRQGH